MSFAGKTAIITGASSGIGMETAKELARQGCHIGLIARRLEKLESVAEEVRGLGVKASLSVADVADCSALQAAIGNVRDELGPIDLLFANAGVAQVKPFDVAEAEQIMRINTLGVIYAVEAVLPEMRERRQGHIAAVSSLAAYRGFPGHAVYCASKAAINAYMDALRLQLRADNIYVTTICPGFIRTPMTGVNKFPMPWLMGPDAAARRIVKALRRKKKVYNFPRRTTMLVKFSRWLPDWIMTRAVGDQLVSGEPDESTSPQVDSNQEVKTDGNNAEPMHHSSGGRSPTG